VKQRAELFRYVGLDVTSDTLTGFYELDGRGFVETVTFEGVKSLEAPAVVALAQLWYLVAGLSYYKAGPLAVLMSGRRRSALTDDDSSRPRSLTDWASSRIVISSH